MKVALLIGSCREGRQSHKIAYYLAHQLKQKEVHPDLIDLGQRTPIIARNSMAIFPGSPEDVEDIGRRVLAADGLIFITPEYHGSFSGVLKNTLDELGPEFCRKPIGVVTVSSGKMGGINAATQLQHVILSLGAFALPGKLLIPDVQTAFDESFQLINERTIKSANKFLTEYLWFVAALLEKRTRDQTILLNASLYNTSTGAVKALDPTEQK